MTASVVTFSNQIGVNGGAVARAVAERLRYRYYDWEVISQAAAEAGVSPEVVAIASAERAPTFIERMLNRLAGSADEDDTTVAPSRRQSLMGSDDFRQFIEHVIRELARRGEAVIVGHAGQAVVRGQPGVLKVMLTGSLERRTRRVMENQGVGEEQALATIKESDRQRVEFFKRAYHMDWFDASAYDVALNTDRLSVELARDMIVACAREVP